MAYRLHSTHHNPALGKVAKLYRDSEWNEWKVIFILDDSHIAAADYFTDDKVDALATAEKWLKEPRPIA